MITNDIKHALKTYAQTLEKNVSFVLSNGDHAKRRELHRFLHDIASVSDRINVEERLTVDQLRSPVSFLIEADGVDTGIRFSGIPSGHEFNSLVLALLHAGGVAPKLDEDLKTRVEHIQKPLHFEIFVSLSCHNCPDVVQTLNQFAVLNPNVHTEMIDGGVFPELIEERDIQGVPSVYLNGELFANGKVDAGTLVEKLLETLPELKQVRTESRLALQDVTVIGGGPAGISAAIYSARKGLAVTLIADRIGGQVKDTMGIENLISVPSTTGPELTGAMQSHLDEYDVSKREHVRVESVETEGTIKKLTLSTGEEIRSKTLIVATGARWRELGVPGEKENIGNGVAYCPHCDGPFFKGKDVAVIGGGNSGIEAALDLAGIVKSVTVFEFLPELRADQILVEKAESTANITILKNVATESINAKDGKVESISYKKRDSGQVHTQSLSGVFVQIGLVPNSQFIAEQVDTTKFGEIIIDEKCKTSVPGIFAAGDVSTVPYKQIVISMGEGAKASLSAFEYLLTEFDNGDSSADSGDNTEVSNAA